MSTEHAAVPNHPRHVSVEIGDVLHVRSEQYRVTGWIGLGMPLREVTLKVEAVEPSEFVAGGPVIPEPTYEISGQHPGEIGTSFDVSSG